MLRRTTTTYATSVSTIVVPTIVTCFTKTMFGATTACRRKKSILDSISLEDVLDENPTPHETWDDFPVVLLLDETIQMHQLTFSVSQVGECRWSTSTRGARHGCDWFDRVLQTRIRSRYSKCEYLWKGRAPTPRKLTDEHTQNEYCDLYHHLLCAILFE